MNKGKIVIISGPSGIGKGTVIRALLQKNDRFKLSVSLTTRQPREEDVDGVSYYFVSRNEFEARIRSGDLFEYTEYNGNLYGTPKSEIYRAQEQGITILLDIEVEGAENFRKAAPENLISIFLVPPSFEELERRLRGRGSEDEQTIQKRLLRAKEELKEQDKYDYVVVNDVLEETIETVYNIIMK